MLTKSKKEKNPDKNTQKNMENKAGLEKVILFNRKEDKKKDIETGSGLHAKDTEKIDDAFFQSKKTLQQLCAPDGVNTAPATHIDISDAGQEIPSLTLYIDKLPLSATFASTFVRLLNYKDVTSEIYINPLDTARAMKLLDKRISVLDGELIAAQKEGDRNRYRKINEQLAEAEGWARDIETGGNALFECTFLFTLRAETLDELRMKANDFQLKARNKGIEVAGCYSCQAEAFLSTGPYNRVFKPSYGPIKSSIAKKHIMDKYSLACIFNHTRSDFSHPGGIIAGRNMHTGQPVTFDIYDPSHNGYGLVICGKTGTGKSATIKMYLSRYVDFGYRIASLDFEPRGNRGEYSLMAERLGGVNYQIKDGTKHIMNPFEISEEEEYDELTKQEYKVLRLTDKISDVTNIFMTMIVGTKATPSFEIFTKMEDKVEDAVAELYEERGIRNMDVDSLYTTGDVMTQFGLTSGRVKKQLPTITDFFVKMLHMQKENVNHLYDEAFALILGSMKKYVRELYYGEKTLQIFTHEEYLSLCNETGVAYSSYKEDSKDKREKVMVVKGRCNYYDGQSNVVIDDNTPHINIDISQLPDADKPIAQLIGLSYLNENYVKRNSINPEKTRKLVMLVDELHKTFPYPKARILVSDVYRTARKRHVSPWSATQAYADFYGYKETEAIITNSTAVLLLKQDFIHKELLEEKTILTPNQVDEVLRLGGDPNERGECKDEHKGEICMICNDRVTFIKVDYLKASEAYIVETESSNIKSMAQGEKKGA